MRAAIEPPHQFNAIDTRSALKVDFWPSRPVPSDRQPGIVAVQTNALDKSYLTRWAQELHVAGEMDRLLRGEIRSKAT